MLDRTGTSRCPQRGRQPGIPGGMPDSSRATIRSAHGKGRVRGVLSIIPLRPRSIGTRASEKVRRPLLEEEWQTRSS
jgi:hypothetical protein